MAGLAWVEVVSSNVAAVAYDGAEGRLWVRFKSGTVGYYARVPESVYRDLAAAGSKGSFLARDVKPKYVWVPGGG